MITKNKRASIQFVLVTMILIIISFFVYLGFFSIVFSDVESETQILSCQSLVKFKDSKVGKIGEYLNDLNNKCYVNKVEIKGELKEDEIFEEFVDLSYSCWRRYGEGEYDFLETYKVSGNYCFVCGEVEFKSNEIFSSEYIDFIDWTKNKENGVIQVDDKELSYYDAINFKFADVDSRELIDLDVQIQDLGNSIDTEGLGSISELLLVLQEKHESILDLRLKTISSDEKYYITYRFDRLDKSLEERLEAAGDTATNSMLGGVLASMALESAIIGGGSFLTCAAGGAVTLGATTLISPLCGFFGGVIGAVKGTITGVKSAAKILQIGKISNKISGMIKYSKVASKIENSFEVLTVSGRTVKIIEKINTLKVTKVDLVDLAAEVRKQGNIEVAEKLDNLVELMSEFNVDNIADISKQIKNNEKTREKLSKMMNSKDLDITDPLLWNSVKKDIDLGNEIGDLKALRELSLEELNQIRAGTKVDEPIATMTYLRGVVFLGGAVVGGLIPLDEPSRQYVDIMTQEQYYRLCGTEPQSFN